MKWCRFQWDARPRTDHDESTVTEVTGNPFESYSKTSTTTPAESREAPGPGDPLPSSGWRQLREHVTEMAHRRGVSESAGRDVGYRANNALVPTGRADRHSQGRDGPVQYEGEAGRSDRQAVQEGLGRRRRSTTSRLHDRQRRQRAHLATGRPHVLGGKNTDTFKPMGPWIVHRLNPTICASRSGSTARRCSPTPSGRDLRRASVHQSHEPVPHALSGRRAVDGHRRRDREHEGR